jgi:hypothetical protein
MHFNKRSEKNWSFEGFSPSRENPSNGEVAELEKLVV